VPFANIASAVTCSLADLSKIWAGITSIVITQPIVFDRVSVDGVRHLWCQPGTCSGLHVVKAQKQLTMIAKDELRRWLAGNEEYRELISRFRVLASQTIELPDPEDND